MTNSSAPHCSTDAFEQSFALSPRPGTLRNLGLAHRALGRYMQAVRELERFTAQIGTEPAEADRVRRIIAEMQAQLAGVRVLASPREARVSIDGREVADPSAEIVADPGRHVLVVAAPGRVTRAENLNLAASEHRRITLSLDRAGRPPWLPWVVGAGAAVIVSAIAVALVVASTTEAPPNCTSTAMANWGFCLVVR